MLSGSVPFFVSGHDFSRADRAPIGAGFSPCATDQGTTSQPAEIFDSLKGPGFSRAAKAEKSTRLQPADLPFLSTLSNRIGDDALIEVLATVGRCATRPRSRCLDIASLHNALVLHQLLVVLVVNLLCFHRGLERLPGLPDALIDACALVFEPVRGLDLGANSQ